MGGTFNRLLNQKQKKLSDKNALIDQFSTVLECLMLRRTSETDFLLKQRPS